MNEVKINKQSQSITFINNGIAFSQFGIAKEILDLVDNQQQKIERLNNIIKYIEDYINFLVIYNQTISGKFSETQWGQDILGLIGSDK